VAPKFIVSAYPKSGAPSRKYANSRIERARTGVARAVMLGVDGIADFDSLHSVKSMRRHRRRRRYTIDLSEWFASVYGAS
jgi:hypothetical protein